MFLISSFELIGTISFAISGAVTGIKNKLDIFGITLLAIITAVGGGILRDVIIGTLPVAFINPSSSVVSFFTALVVFFFYLKINRFEKVIKISDALGLGVFTAIGCKAAVAYGGSNAFLVIAMGLSTGVGGGMIRDILVGDVPMVLKREIYAMASIIGALSFYSFYRYFSEIVSLFLCCAIIFTVRVISIIFKINLPAFKD